MHDENSKNSTPSHALFWDLVEYAPHGVLITGADGTIQYVNVAFTSITGYSREEALGQNPRFLQSGRQGADFYQAMWEELRTKGQWQGEVWNRHKSGALYAEWLSIRANANSEGEISHYFGMFADISSISKRSARLEELAYRDPLTGLPNRSLLSDRLEQAISRAHRARSSFAFLFVDLDGFKLVNDELGHLVGDEALAQVGLLLSSVVREQDTVARLGGDEFALIIEGASDEAEVARACRSIIAGVPSVAPHAKIGASIGVAFYPRDAADGTALIARADAAMYRAKSAGGDCWRLAG